MSKDNYPKDCHDCYKEGFIDGGIVGGIAIGIIALVFIVWILIQVASKLD